MFTYRDFEMGTLGLAWTGDLKNAGGVCEKNGVSLSDNKLFSLVSHVDVKDVDKMESFFLQQEIFKNLLVTMKIFYCINVEHMHRYRTCGNCQFQNSSRACKCAHLFREY